MTTKPTQFTPGPWEVNKSDVCIIGIAKPLGVGCVLPIADVQYNPSRENPGQHVANAALIAAAPAMYEALQAIEARLQGVFDSPALMRQGMLTHDKSADVIRFVRAALAQAEGR